MDTFRRFAAGLAGFILFFSLLATPAIFGLYQASSPEVLKQALRDSGIYNSLLEKNLAGQGGGMLTETVLADPGVKKALSDAAPPAYMQATAEKIIDNAYAYVRGETAAFNFNIDLGEVKTKFADNMAAYAAQKLAALPPCQTLSTPPATLDALLEATCSPRFVSSDQIQANVREEILTGSLLPSGDILNEQTLYRSEGSSFFGPLEMLRAAYPYLAALIYVLPALDILLILGVIFLPFSKRQGTKRVASLLLSSGIINGILSGALLGLSNLVLEDKASASEISIIIWSLAGAASVLWLWISAGFIVLAIAIFITLAFTKQKAASSVGFNSAAQQIKTDELNTPR